ncbi:GNAT family N-acetyltransferase [Exilibacterium tricleocarpae]|uniref:GNAT family N-acetyltransferase n=1 Tax=Exilibacterium tricleocarpae TaxID=2591008 RepID=A0A545SLI5_9GAMM|nr:GNAT family N-acetyltransferase [Exilibacterium tricleocarpae]TQV65843.1 GNAT family N-acetyltransferase [Exilibacterium tricleocarpae]
MKIYHATEKNLEEVVSWIETKQDCRFWGGPSVSYPIRLEALIEEISFRTDNSYVYKVKEKIMAFGQVIKKTEGSNHLARIITSPDSRGKGYGFELCNALVSIAKESGDMITLNVYRTNQAAVSLYEKLGFTEDKDKSTDENALMVKT